MLHIAKTNRNRRLVERGGDMEQVILMYKETPVCEMNLKTGEVKIHGTLPFDLYVEESDDFDDRINNITNIRHWCASRVLSLDRMYAKEILNACNFTQAATDYDKTQIALQYHCLSLRDCYWIKTEKSENQNWKTLNLFHHSLSDAMVDISLNGVPLTIQQTELAAPDCSSQGVAPKAWIREKNMLYLLKGELPGSDAVRKEAEASAILRELGFDVISYEKTVYDGLSVTKSTCYTSEHCNLISAAGYMENEDIQELFQESPETERKFHQMNVADYLVGNTDRHWGNWEFWYDDDRALRFGKLMDFNHAFEAVQETKNLPYQSVYRRNVSQEEAALESFAKAGLDTAGWEKVDWKKYWYGEYVRKRVKRLLQS